jgi:hypothetical protein
MAVKMKRANVSSTEENFCLSEEESTVRMLTAEPKLYVTGSSSSSSSSTSSVHEGNIITKKARSSSQENDSCMTCISSTQEINSKQELFSLSEETIARLIELENTTHLPTQLNNIIIHYELCNFEGKLNALLKQDDVATVISVKCLSDDRIVAVYYSQNNNEIAHLGMWHPVSGDRLSHIEIQSRIIEDLFVTGSNKVIISDRSKGYFTYITYDMDKQEEISRISYAGMKSPRLSIFDDFLIIRNKTIITIWDCINDTYRCLHDYHPHNPFKDELYDIIPHSRDEFILYPRLSDRSEVYFVSYSSEVIAFGYIFRINNNFIHHGSKTRISMGGICAAKNKTIFYGLNHSLELIHHDLYKQRMLNKVTLTYFGDNNYIHNIRLIPGNKCMVTTGSVKEECYIHVVTTVHENGNDCMKQQSVITTDFSGLLHTIGTFSNGHLLLTSGNYILVYDPYKNVFLSKKEIPSDISVCGIRFILFNDAVLITAHDENKKPSLQIWT